MKRSRLAKPIQRKRLKKTRHTVKKRPFQGGNLPYYSGSTAYQKGRGLGGVISKLFRAVVPIFRRPGVQQGLKRLGQSAARVGLEAASKTLSDPNVSFGASFKDSARKEAKSLVKGAQRQMRPVAIKRDAVRVKPLILPSKRKPRNRRDIYHGH